MVNDEIRSSRIIVGLQYFYFVVFCCFCSLTYFNYHKIFYISVLEETDFKRIYPGYTPPTPQEKGTLVKLKGLPFGCTKQDIATFFSGKITITTCKIPVLNAELFLLIIFILAKLQLFRWYCKFCKIFPYSLMVYKVQCMFNFAQSMRATLKIMKRWQTFLGYNTSVYTISNSIFNCKWVLLAGPKCMGY